jgi:hypothetical protein
MALFVVRVAAKPKNQIKKRKQRDRRLTRYSFRWSLSHCLLDHPIFTMTSLQLSIGNTYRRLADSEAALDRSQTYKKVHDWTLFVDVLIPNDGEANTLENAIDRVSFDLGSSFQGNPFLCRSPVPLKRGSQRVWRFSTRQPSYGSVTATIQVRGAGGKVQNFSHRISLDASMSNTTTHVFSEDRGPRPLRMAALPDSEFGIELECTTDASLESIQAAMPVPCSLIYNYGQGLQTMDTWKIVPDSSIACNRSMPNCSTFEIVSPVLSGGNGLSQINKICRALKNHDIKINKSMGFHVHINVEQYSVKRLVKICQQFIKYEDVFDSLMPPSRRTGSEESARYFQSNRDSVGKFLNNKQRNQALARCHNIESLAQLMNAGNSRYYKLNLQNLRTGRQPTLEFRQHSATLNYEKISAWVRLCTHFCRNAAQLVAPSAFLANKTRQDQFEALFWYVIKDRALRDFYRERQVDLEEDEEEEEHCCSGCAVGGNCRAKRVGQVGVVDAY